MKIVIPRQELLDVVNKVRTVVASKSALPILSHMLLEAEEGRLRLAATDLKVSIECMVDCNVAKAGALTVPCHRLGAVLGELPNADVKLELMQNNVVGLECGKIRTKLFSMSPEEFPPPRDFEGADVVTLEQRLLKRLFSRASFAICTDQARYNLTGLLFELQDGNLTVVATDGRRMTLCAAEGVVDDKVTTRVVIPGKMIVELERLLADDGSVDVHLSGQSTAQFCFQSIKLTTSLIEANFPNYEIVVPKKHDKEVIVDTVVFADAVKRTRTMTNDKFNSVRIIVDNGNVTLRVVTPEVGEYEEEFPTEYSGERVEIAFNPDFILDALRRIDTEKTCLLLKDGGSPGVIKPHGDTKNERYVNVVMPIRV